MKSDVMEWMINTQLGRSNLSPIQRIAVAEKYRPIYEKQAKERQGTRNDLKNNFTVNLPQTSNTKDCNPTTDKKLSGIAGVSEKTFRMGVKVLKSDNEDIKQRVLSGETSISALISNNFGRRKNDPVKDRKALATYVELKGYKHGEMGNGRKKTCQNGTSTLDEIAQELNISKCNLQRAL